MRIYWIDEFEKGNIGMMARPRGNDWLEDEIIKLKMLNVDCVISLLEQDEIYELEIEKEAFFCNQNDITFVNYPIRDRGIPEKDSFINLIEDTYKRIKLGEKIAVHCRMGIGRASMVSAGVLIMEGINPNIVFDLLSKKRTLNVPDTNIQKDWILKIKKELQLSVIKENEN